MRVNFFKNAILMFLCLGCFCMSTSFANNYDYSLDAFENRFEEASDDKYYVNPETIVVSSEAIFWCYEGHFIPITSVEYDEFGVFLRPSATKWGLCPRCGYPLAWGFCVNPDCPSKR